jgi:hypothetical protein
MHIHANLAEQLHINEQNLRQRKQFLRLSQHEAELLRKYAGWAEQIAPPMPVSSTTSSSTSLRRAPFSNAMRTKKASPSPNCGQDWSRRRRTTYWKSSVKRSAAATSDPRFSQSVYESAMCIM